MPETTNPEANRDFAHSVKSRPEPFLLTSMNPLTVHLGDKTNYAALTFKTERNDGTDRVTVYDEDGNLLRKIDVSTVPGNIREYPVGRSQSSMEREGFQATDPIIINHDFVSRAHMAFSAVRDMSGNILLLMRDLHSTNGTHTKNPDTSESVANTLDAVRVNKVYQGQLRPVIDHFLTTGEVDPRLLTGESAPLFLRNSFPSLQPTLITQERPMKEIFSRPTEVGTCYVMVKTPNQPVTIVKLSSDFHGQNVTVESTANNATVTIPIDLFPNLPGAGSIFNLDSIGVSGKVVDGYESREGVNATVWFNGVGNEENGNREAISLSSLFNFVKYSALNSRGLR